ncbi:MAG: c-type cytochrome [Desulfuromonadales bacterium]|nr:c-type cytochrome [Desulfuromonadales bacterium]
MAMLDRHEKKHQQATHDFDGLIEIRANPVPRYFALLFYGLIVWAVLFMGYYLLSGWSSEAEFAGKMEAHRQQISQNVPGASQGAPVAAAVSPARAEELYASHCAVCHGSQGEGGIGPSLTATDYQFGREPAAVQASIADGRPGGMPAFGNQLSAGEVAALGSYITQTLGTGR